MKKTIIIFLIHFSIQSQCLDVNYKLIYKKENFITNDAVFLKNIDSVAYLQIEYKNKTNKNIFMKIDEAYIKKFFTYDYGPINYSFFTRPIRENREPSGIFTKKEKKYNYNLIQDCDFRMYFSDKDEPKWEEEMENDDDFSIYNIYYEIQQTLNETNTNKQIPFFNYPNKEKISYLEGYKLHRKNTKIGYDLLTIYLKPNETYQYEKTLVIQQVLGGKYEVAFKKCIFAEQKTELKENIIYFSPKKIKSNQLKINF